MCATIGACIKSGCLAPRRPLCHKVNLPSCVTRRPLCYKVNLLSCVARLPLCRKVNLPSCVARRPLCHKVNLPRCEAQRRHFIMRSLRCSVSKSVLKHNSLRPGVQHKKCGLGSLMSTKVKKTCH